MRAGSSDAPEFASNYSASHPPWRRLSSKPLLITPVLSMPSPAERALGSGAAKVRFQFLPIAATSRHPDQTHKSGPLLGPFLINWQDLSI